MQLDQRNKANCISMLRNKLQVGSGLVHEFFNFLQKTATQWKTRRDGKRFRPRTKVSEVTRMCRTLAVFLIVLALLPGCQSGDGTASSPPSTEAGGSADNWLGVTVETQSLDFELPASWPQSKPSSTMRIAQAAIPGEAGTGELAVFYFGAGQGGGVDANIDRWLQQMEVPSSESPKRDAFQVGDFTITWVDVGGTLKAGSMGMGPGSARPNYRLLGAVVEGPLGPWFFKATGPDETLSAERPTFLAMLRTMRAKSK
jgi:hypothetical protein